MHILVTCPIRCINIRPRWCAIRLMAEKGRFMDGHWDRDVLCSQGLSSWNRAAPNGWIWMRGVWCMWIVGFLERWREGRRERVDVRTVSSYGPSSSSLGLVWCIHVCIITLCHHCFKKWLSALRRQTISRNKVGLQTISQLWTKRYFLWKNAIMPFAKLGPSCSGLNMLTHRGRVTHICVNELSHRCFR